MIEHVELGAPFLHRAAHLDQLRHPPAPREDRHRATRCLIAVEGGGFADTAQPSKLSLAILMFEIMLALWRSQVEFANLSSQPTMEGIAVKLIFKVELLSSSILPSCRTVPGEFHGLESLGVINPPFAKLVSIPGPSQRSMTVTSCPSLRKHIGRRTTYDTRAKNSNFHITTTFLDGSVRAAGACEAECVHHGKVRHGTFSEERCVDCITQSS